MTGPLLLRGDARALPLADESVDVVVTSPPYFGLRDYGTDGQIGAEPTPREFVAALIAATREMVRVLRPSGSIFVNLGDKYQANARGEALGSTDGFTGRAAAPAQRRVGFRPKSLMMLPERYRIACVDELRLTARAVIVWDKPNGLPESVTDRVRRSHEDWVHLTRGPRYFSAVDEIREQHTAAARSTYKVGPSGGNREVARDTFGSPDVRDFQQNTLGRLPGSVWSIPSQPLNVPAHVGADHYAAFPMEWPRRIITGWCPREVCTACGEGRRPIAERASAERHNGGAHAVGEYPAWTANCHDSRTLSVKPDYRITGYACACPDTTAPATPGVVLDPFGGTGTTALVAHMLERVGISVDLSAEYQRIARWRCSDPRERARAAGLDPDQVARIPAARPDQDALFDMPGRAS